MKFYIVEYHHGTEQERCRWPFTNLRDAIRKAKMQDDPEDPDWYARPHVYRVEVKPALYNIMQLAAGFHVGNLELVFDTDDRESINA